MDGATSRPSGWRPAHRRLDRSLAHGSWGLDHVRADATVDAPTPWQNVRDAEGARLRTRPAGREALARRRAAARGRRRR